MKNEERIATVFLGWEPYNPGWLHDGHRMYKRGRQIAHIDHRDHQIALMVGSGTWPDFRSLDGCREFEEALRNRGLLWRAGIGDGYILHLQIASPRALP